MKKIGKALLFFLLLGAPNTFAHRHDATTSAPSPDSLFNLDDVWARSDGKPLRLSDLAGKPTVLAMMYASCRDICPMVVEDMKRIERRLPKDQKGRVNFAVFSFDPERDTTSRLGKYAKSHGIDSPPWVLARGESEAVRRLAVALGLKYRKSKSGDYEHDTLIIILDGAGVVKYRQNIQGKDPEEALRILKKLAR